MSWNWAKPEEGRVKRAKSVKFSEIVPEGESSHGVAIGSNNNLYNVTLNNCTCPDFSISAIASNPQPCKHILALAMKCGIVNENGFTPEQQREEDIDRMRHLIATAYGFYYHFHDPIMSDEDYDKVKQQLTKMEEKLTDKENVDGL